MLANTCVHTFHNYRVYLHSLSLSRVVADEQRTLALGVQSVLWRVFGTIPGPLLFGLVFDSACVYPQHKIGEMGNCWIYDNEKLSYYALAFSLCAALLAALFAGLSWFTYPKERTVKSDEESKNNESAHSDPSDTSTNGSNTPLVVIRPRPGSLPVKKAGSNDQLLQTLSELSSESPNAMIGQRELRARSTESTKY